MTKSSDTKNVALTIMAILVILLVIRYAQAIMVPFLLSVFVAIIISVPVGFLKKLGLSVPFSIGAVLTIVLIVEVLIAWFLGNTLSQFNDALPGYQERLNELTVGFTDWLVNRGINISTSGILQVLDPKMALAFVNTLMLGVGEVLSNAVLIMFTVLFMLLEGWSFPEKLYAMRGIRGGVVMAEIVKVIDSTKHYIAIKTLTSMATGVFIGIGLALLGLDYAVLWGGLAFALNFIPNIGSIIAAVPALLLSLLQLGPTNTLIVMAIYAGVNTLIGSVIEPSIMGRRVGLSTLVVFLALVFWGWLLGPVGMLLSVPLTMVIKFAAQSSEQTEWLAVLLSPTPLSVSHDNGKID